MPALPPPPVTGTLRDVVPYLLRLALAEKQLVWRFAAALGCMLCAKLAGACQYDMGALTCTAPDRSCMAQLWGSSGV